MNITNGIDRVAWHFWGLWWFLWGDRMGMLVYRLYRTGGLKKEWMERES